MCVWITIREVGRMPPPFEELIFAKFVLNGFMPHVVSFGYI